MKVTINVDNNDIRDMLATALEVGSNYWAYIPHFRKVAGYNRDKPASENIIDWVFLGETLDVVDTEEGDYLGQFNLESIERGIQLFVEDGRALDPAMDADESDVLFQYIIMGGIVYG